MRKRHYIPGDDFQCTLCRRSLTVTEDLRVPPHRSCPSSGLTLQGEYESKEPPPDAVVQTRRARIILDKALAGDSGLTHREWAEVADNADNIAERATGLAAHAREQEDA